MVLGGLLVWALTAAADPLVTADCTLCHTVAGHAEAPRDQGCQSCHQWVRAVSADPVMREKARTIFPLWDRYERTVASYLQVPDLQAASRLEPEWVAAWLADPHDVRPNLPEGMPRFGLSAEARAEVAAVVAAGRPEVAPTPAPTADNLGRGAAVFASAGCGACHTFGRLHTEAAVPLAPDLLHTRDRMKPDVVAAWLRSPSSFSPTATMPAADLSTDDLLAVRDYVLLADASAPTAASLAGAPLASGQRVVWAQVEERVFGRICVHCHMDPAQNDGRAGPGNAGGFGWAATGLELQTYESVRAHEAQILAALARRRTEAARDSVSPGLAPASVARPERPGMPLGLPALSDADHQLVVDWFAAGAPRD